MNNDVQVLLKTIFDSAFGKIYNCDNELIESFKDGVLYPAPTVTSTVGDVETLLTNYSIEDNNLVLSNVDQCFSADTKTLHSDSELIACTKDLLSRGFEFALTLSVDGDKFQLLIFKQPFRECVLKNRSHSMTPIVLRFTQLNVP